MTSVIVYWSLMLTPPYTTGMKNLEIFFRAIPVFTKRSLVEYWRLVCKTQFPDWFFGKVGGCIRAVVKVSASSSAHIYHFYGLLCSNSYLREDSGKNKLNSNAFDQLYKICHIIIYHVRGHLMVSSCFNLWSASLEAQSKYEGYLKKSLLEPKFAQNTLSAEWCSHYWNRWSDACL